MRNMTSETCEISFTVRFEFPNCDVDVVYSEVGSAFQGTREVSTQRTPKAESVERALHYMLLCNDFQDLKAECKDTYSLMMGQAQARFIMAPEDFYPQVMDTIRLRANKIMRRFVRYYKQNDKVRASCVVGIQGC